MILGDISELIDSGLRFYVKAQPKARKNAITGILNLPDGKKALKISVTAAPDKGKANKAIIALLAKTWKCPKNAFKLTSGETSRLKTIKIIGNPKELTALCLHGL